MAVEPRNQFAQSLVFDPPEAFRKQAHISSMEEYKRLHEESVKDPDAFWGDFAMALPRGGPIPLTRMY